MKQWYLNLSTQMKLVLSFGIIIGLLLLSIAVGTTGIYSLKDDFTASVNLANFKNNLNVHRVMTLTLLIQNDTDSEISRQTISTILEENQGYLKEIRLWDGANQEYKEKINAMIATYENSINTSNNVVLPDLSAKKFEEARNAIFGIQNKRYLKMSALADDITNYARQLRTDRILNLVFIVMAILFVMIIYSVISIKVLSSNIAEPLKKLVEVANKIAIGDLTTMTDPIQQKDEIGILTQSFHKMTHFLSDISNVAKKIANGDLTVEVHAQSEKDILGNTFSLMINNLKKLTMDISEAVVIVNAATGEISTSAMQLASSASETATAISETSGTIEEVRQTAQHSNQKAKSVVESAQKTAEIAQSGKTATEDNAGGIIRIGEQMSLIAQSMQRLSEQSQMIGDILAAVDDLAQQSNLLAVNAAIEAAKAGEQGKGFSVVAQEIKTLSEQSKQATNQVRSILNDIQKATNVAVMATEEGTKVVGIGRQKSDEAGESIQILASSVSETVETVTQIATISYQQLSGVEQAASAMANIREASNQNVESTRQLEVAANNLKELGFRMKELIGKYKLS